MSAVQFRPCLAGLVGIDGLQLLQCRCHEISDAATGVIGMVSPDLANARAGKRLAEPGALGPVAAAFQQVGRLFRVFHGFGNDFFVPALRPADDRSGVGAERCSAVVLQFAAFCGNA